MVKDLLAEPISPFDLVLAHQNSRQRRRQDLVKLVNAFLYRHAAILIERPVLFADVDWISVGDIAEEVFNAYRVAGWCLQGEVVEGTLVGWMFKLPGKLIGNGNGDSA